MRQNGLLALALKQVFDYSVEPNNEYRFISSDLGFVRSMVGVQDLNGSLIVFGQPYRLTEGRVVLLRAGTVRVLVNLREITLTAHHLVVASSGTVIQFIDMSPDCDLSMLAFTNSFMEGWQKQELLYAYLRGRLYLRLSLDEVAERRVDAIFSLLWDVLHDVPFPKETVQGLISMLFYQITYFEKKDRSVKKQRGTRQEEVLDRFIDLVNKYALHERSVSFYADHLFLTGRYLNTLIRQASGRTVMDWVNEAVVPEAKILLRHSDKLVYQIADELNFPNSSFFCKFFRRVTGMTPYEYRLN